MAIIVAPDIDGWSQRTRYSSADDLVFAGPQSGRPLERTRSTRRFQKACLDAGVRVVRFHDQRHTFAAALAGPGQPLRWIQELLGHADLKTTPRRTRITPTGGSMGAKAPKISWTPMRSRLLPTLALAITLYAFAAWVYVAMVAVFLPQTLTLQLTHFAKWPRTDTFGEICFGVSFVAFVVYRMVRPEPPLAG
jgi:hypothetical protein